MTAATWAIFAEQKPLWIIAFVFRSRIEVMAIEFATSHFYYDSI